MEVCGTHTVALLRSGIRAGLPENVRLVSGPGCPVCVTTSAMIEKAVGLACRKNTVLGCFGDMMRVPGAGGSLESARAERGADVRLMYSPLDALEWARNEPREDIVLFGVGFETTIPLFASVMKRARAEGLENVYLLCAFKLIPPAIEALLECGELAVDGFLLPGHVSSIIGVGAYGFIAEKHHVPGVIAGFEAADMLDGILLLLEMVEKGEPRIVNGYARSVPEEGNPRAREIVRSVFEECDSDWRGLGRIGRSALKLRGGYACFDAEPLIDFKIAEAPEPEGCACGDVVKGLKEPSDCGLFGTRCTPSHPVGPCMVSSEGSCAAYYKYGGN